MSMVPCDAEETQQVLERLTSDWFNEDWQALAVTRRGRRGVEHINETFHAIAVGDVRGPAFIQGEPVIYLVNEVERGLINGTLGKVVGADEEGVSIQFGGQLCHLDWSTARDRIQHAYAISVDKAQGNQFKRIAVVISGSRSLDHALVYTALTCTAEQAVFVGDRCA